MNPSPQYYSDYLKLPELLALQQPVSFETGNSPAHDEMLFVVIHQAYELWFKQMGFELDAVILTMQQPAINDNSPELQTAVHRLHRINTIMRVLVQHMDIMETMTPMDFLDFRDLLRPASGFQSWQFKVFEGRLGLPFDERHGQAYYTSALRPADAEKVKQAETEPTLLSLINAWLQRLPFFIDNSLWQEMPMVASAVGLEAGPFWQHYHAALSNSLAPHERENLVAFEQIMGLSNALPTETTLLAPAACRNALFIMLYRGYPLLQQPFQLLNALLELDEQLSTWRYRHMNMVHRMIGQRIGTGGSSGKNYLKGAADKHYIFKEIAQLTSFLIERRQLPTLPNAVEAKLGFVHA